MLKLARSPAFKSSNWNKQIFLNEGPLIDSLINDVPEQCLDNDVSPLLNIKYLSRCEQDEEKIKSRLYYKGAIIGSLNRLFVSIPTSHPQIKKFVNVHFLVNTVSPFSTLTHRALCAIHQKPFSTELVFEKYWYQIGGRSIMIHLSNPNPAQKKPSHNFHSVNILGMDFLTKYERFLIDANREKYQFNLKLSN